VGLNTWVIVLVKDFDSAKQRLGPALDPAARRKLALTNARRAIRAAGAGDHRLVVAGSEEAAELGRKLGAEVLVEPRQEGQNVAARRGIDHSVKHGAQAVLLLSSDLPLVSSKAVRDVLKVASRLDAPSAVAIPAIGRGGTNGLYLNPPDALGLHFGADSLAAFEREAKRRGIGFVVHPSRAMALDLDEPADLLHVRRAV
jgi:2-phospho-L-lactate guanylyltransferase